MNKENKTIIRALNKYGKVPENWELLNQIEQLQTRINKAIEILHNINEDLPITLILEEIEHSEYVLKGEENDN